MVTATTTTTMNMISRPKIISAHANKYVGKNVTVVGECVTITPHAGTLTLRLPDEDTMIVLLNKNNSTTIEPNLLTEVSGKLVSRGSMESSWIKQYTKEQTAGFNRSQFVEAAHVFEAQKSYYDP